MRIAIATAYPPSKSTLNEYAYYLVKHFVKHPEIEELIIFSDFTNHEKLVDFPVDCKITFEDCWNFNSYKNLFGLIKATKKHKPDVVLFNTQFLGFADKKIAAAMALMTPFFLKLFGYKTILIMHNILEAVDLSKSGFTDNRILAWIYNLIGSTISRFYLQSSLVTVTIDKYVKLLENKYKVKNVALIPHGAFETPPLPDFNLPQGPLKIMTFGKFGTYKKVEKMIEAVEILRKEIDIPLEIVIAGTDNPNVAGYLDKVKKQYSHVKDVIYTGYVAEEDVAEIFKESAVVIFPYTSTTGSSGVLHQAGTYGKAVVLPNIDDLAHLIEEEGYRGEYFDPEDAKSLAEAIKKFVVDTEYRNKIGLTNYKAAVSIPMDDIIRWYYLQIQNLLKK